MYIYCILCYYIYILAPSICEHTLYIANAASWYAYTRMLCRMRIDDDNARSSKEI